MYNGINDMIFLHTAITLKIKLVLFSEIHLVKYFFRIEKLQVYIRRQCHSEKINFCMRSKN